ncbi:tyrosine-type recombinase/integrase [Streptomyces glomeratus]|uniref:tyrosine-type recombinase/integrase n=1 Tax=Streptomyces glomeratus TaxID=284452 RepID=UPI0035564006
MQEADRLRPGPAGARGGASPCRRHTCTPSNSTATGSVRNAKRRPRAGRQRLRLHPTRRSPHRGSHPHPALQHLLHRARLRRIRFHDLRHSTATLLLEEGIELVVNKKLLGHDHIGVTATVYACPSPTTDISAASA